MFPRKVSNRGKSPCVEGGNDLRPKRIDGRKAQAVEAMNFEAAERHNADMAHLRNFYDAVRTGSGVIEDIRFGADAVRIGHMINMACKGRWRDNVFVERLWKSVKYEEVYLKAYGSMAQARTELGRYFEFYNQRRRHQGLDRKTPDEVYMATLPKELVA